MILILAGLALQAAAALAPSSLANTLRARDQRLLDALAPADRAVWDQALAPDAVIVDENGMSFTRAEYLQSLQPLPANVSGHIDIVDYRLQLEGDTAIVVHRDDEFEDFHGHALKATYLMTETWVRRQREGQSEDQGDWQLALLHVSVIAADPPEVAVPPSRLDQYVGRYGAGADLTWIVRRVGDHLTGGREGAATQPLKVESEDVLFVPGLPRERRIFQRTPDGKISGFIWRREGEDIFWKRLP